MVRIAQKLEKGGYKEARLWVMLKDNEKGVAGFCDEMKVAIMSGHIEVDRESKKPKDRLDTELIDTGAFFRYVTDIFGLVENGVILERIRIRLSEKKIYPTYY